jgi:hypothetical protein
MQISHLAERLALFYEYARLLHNCGSRPDMFRPDTMAKICGYLPITSDTYTIPRDSFLYRLVEKHSPMLHLQVKVDPLELDMVVSTSELFAIRREALFRHLRERISEQNELCRSSPHFSLCLNFAITGICNRVACPREHTRARDMTPQLFTTRVRLHVLRILFNQSYFVTGAPEETKIQRRLANDCFCQFDYIADSDTQTFTERIL